jgi:hypothetical protein
MARLIPRLVLVAGLVGGGHAAGQQNPLQPQAPAPKSPSPEAPPPPPPEAPKRVEDGPSYEVTTFVLRYAHEHPDQPPIEDLENLDLKLGELNGTFVAPRDEVPVVELRMSDLTGAQRAGRKFSVSAINAIGARIVQALNARGIIGVMVAPDADQIDLTTLKDKRAAGVKTLNLDIWTREVKQVRTLGQGPRWAPPTASGNQPSQENRINHPYHERIRFNSPLQPGTGDVPGDLLRRDWLDDYIYRLNRHPGRRVDGAIASGEKPGEIVLDYLVTENRPWTLYGQISNTGTKETNEWRERAGFIHNQLRNNDDIFSVDFITAAFNSANALVSSYDTPILGSEYLRLKIYGSYSDYTASDVGFAGEDFTGRSYSAGGELDWNIYQRKMLFVDAFGGARYEHQEVTNHAVDLRGESGFFIPYAGVRAERSTVKASTSAEIRLETNLPGVASTGDDAELNALGRLFVNRSWTAIKWDVSQSFYLEPLIFGKAWEDPSSPERQTRLVQEIALSFRGQNSLGNRLIPQEEATAGGLYTVRGYPESAVAGDDLLLFSAEYRYHLPRAWAIQENQNTKLFGKPFRWHPDQRYGSPDWDLVLKGFLDVARVTNSDKQSFEKDETLSGIGVGVEFVFRRNVNLRLDWGFALQDAKDTKSGDSRVHIVATFLY